MNKRVVFIFVAALAALTLVSCEKQEPQGINLSYLPGKWVMYKKTYPSADGKSRETLLIENWKQRGDSIYLLIRDDGTFTSVNKQNDKPNTDGTWSVNNDSMLVFSYSSSTPGIIATSPITIYPIAIYYHINYLVKKEISLTVMGDPLDYGSLAEEAHYIQFWKKVE